MKLFKWLLGLGAAGAVGYGIWRLARPTPPSLSPAAADTRVTYKITLKYPANSARAHIDRVLQQLSDMLFASEGRVITPATQGPSATELHYTWAYAISDRAIQEQVTQLNAALAPEGKFVTARRIS